MWTCTKCKRIFIKAKQPHSCKVIPLEVHFKNKDYAKELFYTLVGQINNRVGKCKILSIPCCIHLFGRYDFLAALPKKDKLEIRFALNYKLDNPRLKQYVPMSNKIFKNCIDITQKSDVDSDLIEWLNTSFHLKDN